MKKYISIFCLAVGFICLTIVSGQAEVNTGELAPDFTIQDSNGEEHSLPMYKGKFVVLEWFNHDCPFVKKHYGSGNMQKLQKTYTSRGVTWLSVSSSAPGKQGYYGPTDTNRLTEEKGASPTAVLFDPDGTVGRMYGAATTPHVFIIDPEGRLIYQGAIDSVPGTDQAQIAQADNYVEAVLNAALAGKPVDVPSTKSYGCSVKY